VAIAPLLVGHGPAVGDAILIRWLITAPGLWLFAGIDEATDHALRPRASLPEQPRRAWAIRRRDAVYQRFIVLRASLTPSGAAIPLYRVYVEGKLGDALDMVGVYRLPRSSPISRPAC
jgi:hypothetical protein